MVQRKDKSAEDDVVLPPPASTLEGREDQLIAAAFDLVETRIRAGTASAQETVHFVRLGSRKNKLEEDKLRAENEVLKSRVKQMESQKSQEDLLERALNAFKGYSGQVDPFENAEEDGYDDPDLY
jgi:hypothetical protein